MWSREFKSRYTEATDKVTSRDPPDLRGEEEGGEGGRKGGRGRER